METQNYPKKAEDEPVDNTIEFEQFEDLDIPENILKGVYAYGWEVPSPIQKKAIFPIISGRDTIAQSQSGTGKTGSFTIASLSIVDENLNEPQVLILAPVHDLAIQIYKTVNSLSHYAKTEASLLIGKGLNSSSFDKYDKREDIPNPNFNNQVFVGTPGRVLDSIQRNKLRINNMKLFILDEADEMLSKGFKDQIRKIFSYLPQDMQVSLFSATLPKEILDISSHFMKDPLRILVKKENLTLEGIRQFYVSIANEDDKFNVLLDIYDTISVTQTIIFVNSKPKVMQLKERLEANNYPISMIHGGMNQYERNDILDSFRNGKSRILISTDVLSRGIDIQQISLVINYDIPYKVEQYIHRIGRSGRFGRKGVGINFVTNIDAQKLKRIEEYYNTQIEALPMDYGNYLSQ